MPTLFISDLHLEPQKPAITQAFLSFLEQRTQGIDALYILGDLFEAWIGDDYENEWLTQIKLALRQVSERGIALYFMHGNRDFLIGTGFAAETGCTLLQDPTRIDLFGTPALLMHGDTLCTEDVAYLEFRAMVRNPAWQQGLLAKSIPERLAIAKNLREQSQSAVAGKTMHIMDVTEQEVERVLQSHQVPLLIHGHTHRPQIHNLQINGQAAQRIVLGDWSTHGWVLSFDQDGPKLTSFPID